MNMRNIVDFKDLYMPFDCLLFFTDGGNDDLFGYSILNGKVQRDDIYMYGIMKMIVERGLLLL